MSVFALTDNETAWLITLVVGLVVAGVVWLLLELLRRTVLDVERSLSELWIMGKRVAQNTATTHQLLVTRERAGELLAEVERHRPPSARSEP
jgi:uncharacterized protein HemY